VHQVFSTIIAFGTSKHEAKIAARNKNNARAWHELGKNLLVYSYNTADSYRDISKEAFAFAKQNLKLNTSMHSLKAKLKQMLNTAHFKSMRRL
jgi:hypothetical protein